MQFSAVTRGTILKVVGLQGQVCTKSKSAQAAASQERNPHAKQMQKEEHPVCLSFTCCGIVSSIVRVFVNSLSVLRPHTYAMH